MSKALSVLDHEAVSGAYLFPQPRILSSPWLVSVDGAELACWRSKVDASRPTIVHFHGNGEAVADYVPFMGEFFDECGANVVFVEYRGYGSSTGEAQLVEMLGDGEAVWRAAGIAPERTIAFGRSIGSLYAIELVHRQPKLAGLILESGIADPAERFLRYANLAGSGLSAERVKAEARRQFDHQTKLAGYRGELLVLHAAHDDLVDISHAERNFAWAGAEDKRLVRLPRGDHNSIFAANVAEYRSALCDFIQRL